MLKKPVTLSLVFVTLTLVAAQCGSSTEMQVREKDGATMVYVPAGEFTMGSNDDEVNYATQLCNTYYHDCGREWFEYEQPQHTVYLDAFYIDRYEVTNAQFAAFVSATGYETDAEREGWGLVYESGSLKSIQGADWRHPFGPDTNLAGKDKHPVVQTSWNDAKAYCEWAGGRLPTEAEWEYTARGPEGQVFPWGDEFDGKRLNFCDANCGSEWADKGGDDGYSDTAPVGSYPGGASWCGALDMAGNVWEWVADWYGAYSAGRQLNPTGPSSAKARGLRGGSWDNTPDYVRCADRWAGGPAVQFNTVGFRCARGSE